MNKETNVDFNVDARVSAMVNEEVIILKWRNTLFYKMPPGVDAPRIWQYLKGNDAITIETLVDKPEEKIDKSTEEKKEFIDQSNEEPPETEDLKKEESENEQDLRSINMGRPSNLSKYLSDKKPGFKFKITDIPVAKGGDESRDKQISKAIDSNIIYQLDKETLVYNGGF